jgi:hypothetical protein
VITLANLHLIRELREHDGKYVAFHSAMKGRRENGRDMLVQGCVRADATYVGGGNLVLVPVEEARQQLVDFGHPEDDIRQVGFMVPQAIRDMKLRRARVERLTSGEPVTVGFWGTGASPREHFKLLMGKGGMLDQVAGELLHEGMRLMVYTFTNERLGMNV